MSEWVRCQLSDVCDFFIGGTPSRNQPEFWATPPSGSPWLAISDLKSKFLWRSKEHITELGALSSNVKIIPPDSTVMSFKLSIGRAGITKTSMYCNEAIAFFKPIPGELDSRWLYHAIPRAADKVVTDSAVKGATLNKKKIAEIPLHLPPLDEQVGVAEVLDILDTQIQKTEALIAKLEKVKEGLLHDLLTRGIDENGRLRPSPEQAPELYKESSLGLIPREWETRQISDLSTKVTNGFVGVATPHYTESLSGVTYLYGNNIRKNRIDFSRHERVTQAFHKSQVKSQLKNGDMLTVQSGHIGTSAVYDSSAGEANCHALIITRFTPSRVNSRFASLYLNSALGMLAQGRLFIGSTILHINTSDLAKLEIPVPDLNEQERVIGQFLKIEERLQLEARQRDSLIKLKKGLMDDLLTGRVRVTPLLEQAQAQDTTPA